MTEQLHQSQPPAPEGGPVRAGFVRVPHRLLADDVSPHALMLWVQLSLAAQGTQRWFRASYPRVQLAAGWRANGAAEGTLNRRCWEARKQLEKAGLVRCAKRHTDDGHTVPLYKLPTIEGRYELLPTSVLATLTGPEAEGDGSLLLRHWLAYARILLEPVKQPTKGQRPRFIAADRAASRTVSVQEVASATGTGRDKTRKIRHALLRLGVLFEQASQGGTSLLSLEPFKAAPQDQTEPEAPLPGSESHPYREAKVTPTGKRKQERTTVPVNTKLHTLESVRSTVTSVPGEVETADKPPSQDDAAEAQPEPIRGSRGDWAERAAWDMVSGVYCLQGTTDERRKLRYMAVSAIAHELRRSPDRDLALTRRQIIEHLEDAEFTGRLDTNHVPLIREALRIHHADKLAATAPATQRGTVLAPSQPAAPSAGPEPLEALSARVGPRLPSTEADAYAWAVPWFARLALQAEATDRDVAEVLDMGLVAAQRQLGQPGWFIELQAAQRLVLRSAMAS